MPPGEGLATAALGWKASASAMGCSYYGEKRTARTCLVVWLRLLRPVVALVLLWRLLRRQGKLQVRAGLTGCGGVTGRYDAGKRLVR